MPARRRTARRRGYTWAQGLVGAMFLPVAPFVARGGKAAEWPATWAAWQAWNRDVGPWWREAHGHAPKLADAGRLEQEPAPADLPDPPGWELVVDDRATFRFESARRRR